MNPIAARLASLRQLFRTPMLLALSWVGLAHPAAPPGQNSPAAQSSEYVLATATPGGTFHEAGLSFANLINVRQDCPSKMGITPLATNGTEQNLQLLAKGVIELAIVQGFAAKAYFEGDPDPSLRSVMALWQNVEHFLIRTELADTDTIRDFRRLAGHSVYLGSLNSGSLKSTRAILTALEIDTRVFETDDESYYAEAATRFIKGELDAASLPGGIPVNAVDRILNALGDQVRLLRFDEEQLQQLRQYQVKRLGAPFWQTYPVFPDDYVALAERVDTIAQPVYLIARADVPVGDVQCILSTYLKTPAGIEILRVHPALTRSEDYVPFPEDAPFPFHDGACVYAAKGGFAIPDGACKANPSAPN